MQFRVLGVLLALVLFSGCATMSRDECLVSDWRAIGYEDGARGYTSDRLGQHRKACADHGVAPDLDAYKQGRSEGLEEFCQPQNGFDLGSRGGQYRGVCPAGLEDSFVEAYRTGRHLYELESNVQSAARQIAYKKNQLDSLKRELAEKSSRLIASGVPTEERAKLLIETKEIAEEQGRLEAEILDLAEDKGVREEQLAAYRASLAYNY